ncbi:MAG: hypothetical protein Q8N51_17400 [Gammaproteobacteria bacterium]|nr:hypothetical protein [Gammaproteobacteria bacterium]
MARFPHSRLALAVLGALHFLAAPCVMAMAIADAPEPCEHCPPGSDAMSCLTTATDPAIADAAPAPGRFRPAVPPVVGALLPSPIAAVARSLTRASPAQRIAFATGRHTGDPPLNVLYQNFRN